MRSLSARHEAQEKEKNEQEQEDKKLSDHETWEKVSDRVRAAS